MDKSPDAFRTISEAAEELDLPQHVLRFWETRFATIKPLKRGGGRRYYRPEDVMLLRGIRHLLYDQGFTIKGVQRILKEQGARHVVAIGENGAVGPMPPQAQHQPIMDAEGVESIEFVETEPGTEQAPLPAGLGADQRERLANALEILLECRATLDRARRD